MVDITQLDEEFKASRPIVKGLVDIEQMEADLRASRPASEFGPFTVAKEKMQGALKKTGNTLLDNLAYLDRPRNALALGVKSHYAGKGFMKGAIRGLKGEDFFSTQEFLGPEIMNEHPVLSGIFGFVGDVSTDPLTYTPAGIVSAPAKAATRLASKVPVLGKTKDTSLAHMFNVYRGDLKQLKQLEDRARDLAGYGRFTAIRDVKEWNKKLDELAKDLDMDRDLLNQAIVNQIETPIDVIHPKIAEAANFFKEKNELQFMMESELGVPIKQRQNYFPHIATPEARRAMKREEVKQVFSKNPLFHTSLRPRRIEGSITEINQTGKYDAAKFFYDDPAVAQAVRDVKHANVVAGAHYIKSVTQNYGMWGEAGEEAAKEGWRALNININQIKDVKFHPEVARIAEQQYKIMSNTEEVMTFLKVFDSAQNWWKMWSLGIRPAYHMRNAVGNVWNNYLGGVKNPYVYHAARRLQTQADAGTLKGRVAGYEAKTVWEEAAKHGVLGRSQFHGDIPVIVEREIEKTVGDRRVLDYVTPSTRNVLLQKGFNFGHKIEQNARLAHFIDRLNKGDNFEDAARSVKKHLFDYEDLSPFEKNTMKRLVPFYTWSRKNIPLQIEYMAMRPDKFQVINIARNQFHIANTPPDTEYTPEFLRELGPIYFGETPDGDRKAVVLLNYLPFMDVQRIASPIDLTSTMVTPYIKEVVEQMANYDAFRKTSIDKLEKLGMGHSTVDFLGIEMPARIAHLLRNIVVLNEIDRANPGNIFGSNRVDPETGERIIEPAFFGYGARRETRTDLQGKERLLQFLVGLKPYPVDDKTGRAKFTADLRRDIREAQALIRGAGRRGKTREVEQVMEALRNYVEQIKKNQ